MDKKLPKLKNIRKIQILKKLKEIPLNLIKLLENPLEKENNGKIHYFDISDKRNR